MSRVAILGAGITGLSLAWFLKKKGISVTLFEKEARPGGWIRTEHHQGNLFECGPRSLRSQDAQATLDLIEEMGLSQDIIYSSPESKTRYILRNGKLEKLGFSFNLLPALLKDLVSKRSCLPDESVHAFFSRRFSTYIADQYVDPLIKGIYAGDAKQVSMRACFPGLWDIEQNYRSLLIGSLFQPSSSKKILTLKNGMGSFITALADRLKNEIVLNTEVHEIKGDVISTLPAHRLASILPNSDLKSLLLKIPFASVGVVHLGYTDAVNPYKGFGYLVPSHENELILGTVFDSSAFPSQNSHLKTRLTVMIGGSHCDSELKVLALEAVAKHLGISAQPAVIEAFTAKQAIPQYPVGFHSLLSQIYEAKKEFPTLSLLGTSFSGVSVNQCIASAKQFTCRGDLGFSKMTR